MGMSYIVREEKLYKSVLILITFIKLAIIVWIASLHLGWVRLILILKRRSKIGDLRNEQR